MDPLTLALISGGIGILGNLLAPKPPDIQAIAARQAAQERRQLEADLQFRTLRQADLNAASGLTGASQQRGFNELFRSSNSLRAQIDAAAADRMNEAAIQQEQFNFEHNRQRFQNMISGAATGIELYANSQIGLDDNNLVEPSVDLTNTGNLDASTLSDPNNLLGPSRMPRATLTQTPVSQPRDIMQFNPLQVMNPIQPRPPYNPFLQF